MKPERVDEFQSQACEVASFTNGKDGPILYRFFQNVEQPNQFVLFEEWFDLTTVRRHRPPQMCGSFKTGLPS